MDLIFALVTNYATKAKTVVELSLNKFFKRKYSSLSRAIGGYFTSRKNNTNRDELRSNARNDIKSFLLKSALEGEKGTHSFAIDITGNIKRHSAKAEDRSHIFSGSIAGMSIGHNYRVIGKKDKEGWMLPVAIDRIPHSENKYEFSVSQVEFILNKVPSTDASILVGDSVYSCNKFIYKLSKRENVAIITRMRANKAIYEKYNDKKEGSGRKRKYGKKSSLNKPESLPKPNLVDEFEELTKKGEIQRVRLSFFKGYICRGSKDYKMSEIEINFVRVEIFKENGERKYDRDLWIGISGKARAKVSMKDAYYEYKDRFNLEHYFKFSKSKFLMDKLQSSDPKKDEDFMMFGAISYHVLCKSADLLDNIQIRPWENKKKMNVKSPSNTFRAASVRGVFDEVYQDDIKQRGVPDKRNIRKSFKSKANQPILKKARDPTKLELEIKSRFGKSHNISKTSLNTEQESKEDFKKKILEKAEEIYEKIHTKVE
jgi:hypothetical protein